jgi:serine/threonine protein kinase
MLVIRSFHPVRPVTAENVTSIAQGDSPMAAPSTSLCPGCFQPRDKGTVPTCGFCGYNPHAPRPLSLLPVGAQLQQYVIGERLGQGGFGITYRGFDLKLRMKVAIKEYYPADFVGRSSDQNTLGPVKK